MGIVRTESLHEWNYFIALERDLEKLSRYVAFSENNYQTFSIEMARLLLASASEVDVVAKSLCGLIDSSQNPRDIKGYRKIIQNYYTEIDDLTVEIPRYGILLNPWQNWNDDCSPTWWKAYNKVKHQRKDHFNLANLNNVLNSISALFILDLLLYTKQGIERLDPPPDLFNPPRSLGMVCPSIQGRVGLFIGAKHVH